MINIRTKGAGGEREVADDLNAILKDLYKDMGLDFPAKPIVQRNQNQSAVGGKDLVGTFGLAIEVKRQEALSINTWWKQCAVSALELQEKPVLLFRQNGKKWRCITLVDLPVQDDGHAFVTVRAEIEYDAFKSWFRTWAQRKIADAPSPEIASHPGLFD